MKDKSKYNKMVNISYLITAVTYVIMAIAGYLMFGQEAMQEVKF
jgi:vesicular inhibitory amino acid transporter